MAITRVQTVAGLANGAGSGTATLSGVVAGNTIVVSVTCWQGTNGSSATPTGITTGGTGTFTKDVEAASIQIGGNGWEHVRTSIWRASNVSAGTHLVTVSWNGGTGTYGQFTVTEYSGLATSTPLDQSATGTGTGTSPSVGPSGTTTQANELVVAMFGASSFGTTNIGIDAATPGYTNIGIDQDSATVCAYASEFKTVAATGTQSCSWGTVAGNTVSWSMALATYKEAVAAETPPAFVAATATGATTLTSVITGTAVTPTMPAGHAADDIALALVSSDISDTNLNTSSTGWAKIGQVNQTGYSAGLFWKRLTSGAEANPTFNSPARTGTNVVLAASISVWRGCVATGDPWEAYLSNQGATSPAAGNATGIVVAGTNRTVLAFLALGDDIATTTPAGWTERAAPKNTTGNDQGHFHDSRTQATAGTVAAPSRTLSAANPWAIFTLALKPIPVSSGTTYNDTVTGGDVTAGDSSSAAVTFTTPVPQAMTLGDTSTVAGTFTASADQTQTLGDSATAANTVPATSAETMALGDSATGARTTAGAAPETFALGDTSTAANTLAATAAQPVTLGDTSTASNTIASAAADTYSLTDAAAGNVSKDSAAPDSFTLGDGSAVLGTFSALASNPLSLGDTSTASKTTAGAAAETQTLGDTSTTLATLTAPVAETLTLADGASASATRAATAAETTALGDTSALATTFTAAAPESMGLGDAVSAFVVRSAVAADTLTLGDGLTAQATLSAQVSDAYEIIDGAQSTTGQVSTTSDTITAGDAAAAQATFSTTAPNTLTLGDAAAGATTLAATAPQAIALGDTSAASVTHNADASETFSIGDAATGALGSVTLAGEAADGFALGDGAAATVTHTAASAETYALADDAANTAAFDAHAAETFALSDGASVIAEWLASVSEPITLDDAATAGFTHDGLAAETYALGDDAAAVVYVAPGFGVVASMEFQRVAEGQMVPLPLTDGGMEFQRLTDGGMSFEDEPNA